MVHNPMLPPRKRARVKAGLSSMEAIRTATYNPAFFLGREKDLGTIESGKLAECWTHRGDRVNTGAILYTERGVSLHRHLPTRRTCAQGHLLKAVQVKTFPAFE
jgi:cytosine/adenosine deaminase-related metal-dependent hydrolase